MAHDSNFLHLLDDGVPASPSESPRSDVCGVSSDRGRDLMIVGDTSTYEGASNVSRELALWKAPRTSADRDVIPARSTLDPRTRDSARNDAQVQGGVQTATHGVVGAEYVLMSAPLTKYLWGKEDDDWESEFQEEVEEKFSLYAESPDFWIDASAKKTLTDMVRLGVSNDILYGEDLTTVEWANRADRRRPFRTMFQAIDTDRLSTPPEFTGDPMVRGGIRRDAYGAPQGAYIQVAHPSDSYVYGGDVYRWKYVPIRKPWGRLQYIHLFEEQRADQTRGIARMVAALKEMRMGKKFRDIVLQKAVHNATYAATIESDMPTAEIFARLGGVDMTPEAVQDALGAYMAGHFTTLEQFMQAASNLQIDGVKIPHLPPGAKLQLRDATQSGPLGDDFERSIHRYICSALGISYEEYSKDFSKTNYSGFKGAVAITKQSVAIRKRRVADRKATYMFRLWFEEAFNRGEFETLKRRNVPSIYDRQNLDAYTACNWIGAASGQIDELKETQAAVLRIDNGLTTYEEEHARLGGDWRKKFRQIKREQDWKKFYDILPNPTDTTNQMNAASGAGKTKNAKKTSARSYLQSLDLDATPEETE